MWYLAGAGVLHKGDNQTFYTGYAESEDGKYWTKPVLDIWNQTNIVDTCNRDAATIWLTNRRKTRPNGTRCSMSNAAPPTADGNLF